MSFFVTFGLLNLIKKVQVGNSKQILDSSHLPGGITTCPDITEASAGRASTKKKAFDPDNLPPVNCKPPNANLRRSIRSNILDPWKVSKQNRFNSREKKHRNICVSKFAVFFWNGRNPSDFRGGDMTNCFLPVSTV